MKKKVILIIACVLAAAIAVSTAVTVVTVIRDNDEVSEYTVPRYSGSMDGKEFELAFSKYGSRTEPQKVYVSSTEELGLNDIPVEPIGIYSYRHTYFLKYVYGEESLYAPDSLEAFAQEKVSGLWDFLGAAADAEPEYFDFLSNRLIADIGTYSLNFKQYPFYHELELRKSDRYKNKDGIMRLNGKRLVFGVSSGDEEIIAFLEEQKEALFGMLGCSFEDIKVVRNYTKSSNTANYITVYFYNEKDSVINKYAPLQSDATFEEHDRIGFYSDYIAITFVCESDSKAATAKTIKYVEFRTPPEETFVLLSMANVIPLQAAEEMLFSNKFFSGNVCVLCAGEDIKITEYDYVSFEYLAGDGFRNYYDTRVLPFYVFYVKEDGKQPDVYSKYYVPAVYFYEQDNYWTYGTYYREHQQHKTEESEEDVYG